MLESSLIFKSITDGVGNLDQPYLPIRPSRTSYNVRMEKAEKVEGTVRNEKPDVGKDKRPEELDAGRVKKPGNHPPLPPKGPQPREPYGS